MRTVEFCFYVSGKYDKGFISPLIGWIGWMANKKKLLKIKAVRDYMKKHGLKRLSISHEEILFENRVICNGYLVLYDRLLHRQEDIKGLCFSSASRGGKIGVRFAPASEIVDKHPERWIRIPVELPDVVEQAMFDAAKSIEGAGYDWLGIIGKTTWFTDWFQSYDRWYCSEACNWVAHKICKIWGDRKLPIDEFYKGGFNAWNRFDNCFRKHRRWSPVANLWLMLDAGYYMK